MPALLLTSSVIASTPGNTITSATTRLAQLLSSIEFWCQTGAFDTIVVVDSSDAGIDPAKIPHPGVKLEWLSYDLRKVAYRYGKGRAEAIMIARAIQDSQLLPNSFYKATGRLAVANLKEVQASITDEEAAFAPGASPDTRFYYTSKDFFLRHLAPLTGRIVDYLPPLAIESVYAPVMKNRHFKVAPEYVGRSGWSGIVYDQDYRDFERHLEMAKSMLPVPDLKIYCLYHDTRIRYFEKLGFLDPEADNVVFVKNRKMDYTFPCKHHLDLTVQEWFQDLGVKYQEYSFLYSLYHAAKAGKIVLPEFIGFAHYDMNLTQYDVRTPLTKDTAVLFAPYYFNYVIKQNITSMGKEITQEYMAMFGRTWDPKAEEVVGMCTSAIMHRDNFMFIMESMTREIHDEYSIINRNFYDKHYWDLTQRWAAIMGERHFGIALWSRGPKLIYNKLDHYYVQSYGVQINA